MNKNAAWRESIRALLEQAGVRNIEQDWTGSSHVRFKGTVAVRGGREASIVLVCSNTPKDRLALHRVRGDIRRIINDAKGVKHVAA